MSWPNGCGPASSPASRRSRPPGWPRSPSCWPTTGSCGRSTSARARPRPARPCPGTWPSAWPRPRGAALTDQVGAKRWSTVLEALALSPVHAQVEPASIPASPNEELIAAVTKVSMQVPQIAAKFGIEPKPAPRSRGGRSRPRTGGPKPGAPPPPARAQGPPHPAAPAHRPTPPSGPAHRPPRRRGGGEVAEAACWPRPRRRRWRLRSSRPRCRPSAEAPEAAPELEAVEAPAAERRAARGSEAVPAEAVEAPAAEAPVQPEAERCARGRGRRGACGERSSARSRGGGVRRGRRQRTSPPRRRPVVRRRRTSFGWRRPRPPRGRTRQPDAGRYSGQEVEHLAPARSAPGRPAPGSGPRVPAGQGEGGAHLDGALAVVVGVADVEDVVARRRRARSARGTRDFGAPRAKAGRRRVPAEASQLGGAGVRVLVGAQPPAVERRRAGRRSRETAPTRSGRSGPGSPRRSRRGRRTRRPAGDPAGSATGRCRGPGTGRSTPRRSRPGSRRSRRPRRWGGSRAIGRGHHGGVAGPAPVLPGGVVLVPAGSAGGALAAVQVDGGQVQAADVVGRAERTAEVHRAPR